MQYSDAHNHSCNDNLKEGRIYHVSLSDFLIGPEEAVVEIRAYGSGWRKIKNVVTIMKAWIGSK